MYVSRWEYIEFVENSNYYDVAVKSAEITEQIAIEFLQYFQQTAELGFYSTGENYGKSHKQLFQEFIKTKL